MECQLPEQFSTDEQILRVLRDGRRIAVVGASDRPDRDSFHIVQFLVEQGYTVFPVNPKYRRVAGLSCYDSLDQIAGPVDIVDVFRRSDAVDGIVEQAVRRGDRCLWLQEGVVNNAAARRAADAGLTVVQNKCIYKEHIAHLGG